MTPKEKAKELIDKFYQTTPNESFYNPPIGSVTSAKYTSYGQAIQCALIAVDEMLNNELLTDLIQLPDDSPHKYKAIYQKMWLNDVKNELLKRKNNG